MLTALRSHKTHTRTRVSHASVRMLRCETRACYSPLLLLVLLRNVHYNFITFMSIRNMMRKRSALLPGFALRACWWLLLAEHFIIFEAYMRSTRVLQPTPIKWRSNTRFQLHAGSLLPHVRGVLSISRARLDIYVHANAL